MVLHKNNNNTVEEAIYFGNYFKNCNSEIKIITNDWHYNRVNYLFSKVFDFFEIKNYEIIKVKSNNIAKNLSKEEKEKLDQLIKNPYGTWNKWMKNNI